MPGRCAFCDVEGSLTREHIWPRCIIEREPNYVMRYTGRADKVVGADLVVKDVCSNCNSGVLSALDSYVCQLFDRYFHGIVGPKDTVEFQYDYSLLLRWLLKLSFNSARANSEDVQVHLSARSFILGTAPVPENVSVMLDIVVPSTVNGIVLEPRATRCARILLDGRHRDWVTLRLVAINSYYFYVVLTTSVRDGPSLDDLLEFRRGVKGVKLRPRGRLVLRDHATGFLEVYAPHFLAKRDKYAEFLKS